MRKFKEGAASFYIVAISTLILLIVAMSFAAVIISEVTRTSNDDLSQSAYDSALAGVEDAKLAYYNYQNCKANSDSSSDCAQIIQVIEEGESCDMVANALGRNVEADLGVVVEEGASNNMAQAYTCVKFTDSLVDYRSTLSASNMIKVMRAKFDNGIKASSIKRVRVSWYRSTDREFNYGNFNNDGTDAGVIFPSMNMTAVLATPPTISVTGLQTASEFALSDFDITHGNETDKWMTYLVPIGDQTKASTSKPGNYNGTTYSNGVNLIDKNALLKSNDKTKENLPYGVFCDRNAGSDFACSAEFELPDAYGGARSDDTFIFVVGLPYGGPPTDFNIEFFCGNGESCGSDSEKASDGGSRVALKGVQLQVDSTGRANDLFRRVETRLEDSNDFALSLMGPLELFGDNNEEDDDGDKDKKSALKKNYAVTCEYNFNPVANPNCN